MFLKVWQLSILLNFLPILITAFPAESVIKRDNTDPSAFSKATGEFGNLKFELDPSTCIAQGYLRFCNEQVSGSNLPIYIPKNTENTVNSEWVISAYKPNDDGSWQDSKPFKSLTCTIGVAGSRPEDISTLSIHTSKPFISKSLGQNLLHLNCNDEEGDIDKGI
ncbi:uncharacterized protein L201_000666 [Kwoniella dendrophila CBS 6074]|uniref:Uncharacterized protein n=1 Tax=Kwoniella dendrophila CBS 6074 TaxID=1295534 RepID=A0AAX4JK72_9TREE